MTTKKTTKRTTKKAPKKTAPLYNVVLTVMARRYLGSGGTIVDALASLQPGNAAGVGILFVENTATKETQTRIIPGPILKRTFSTFGLTRDVSLKNLSLRFGI